MRFDSQAAELLVKRDLYVGFRMEMKKNFDAMFSNSFNVIANQQFMLP